MIKYHGIQSGNRIEYGFNIGYCKVNTEELRLQDAENSNIIFTESLQRRV